jgi:hypothetical protein
VTKDTATNEVWRRALLLPTQCISNGGACFKVKVLSFKIRFCNGESDAHHTPATAHAQTLAAIFITMNILLIIVLVFALNGLWFWIKSTLKENGYPVSWFWNHFQDIPNIFGLAIATTDKQAKTKYYAMAIFLVVGIVAFPIIAFNLIPSIGDNRCSFQKEFNYREWNGVVIDKHLDRPNHNFETLELRHDSTTTKIQDLVTDFNNSYDSIRIGDSLSKKRGNNFVSVFREGKVSQLTVDCGCRK